MKPIVLTEYIPNNITVPFLSGLQAGFPSPAADYTEDEIDLKSFLMPHPSSTFIMRIEGESMLGIGITSGSLVVVDRSVKPANNSIVVAVINGEYTCKRLRKRGNQCILQPENAMYLPIVITEEMNMIIWGTVTRVIIDATKI